MPIYEYYCINCKLQFELMLPFSKAEKIAKCPKCKEKCEKLISNFASQTGSCLQTPEKPYRKLAKDFIRKSPKTKNKRHTTRKK